MYSCPIDSLHQEGCPTSLANPFSTPPHPFLPSILILFFLFSSSRVKRLLGISKPSYEYFAPVLVPVLPVPRWFVARDDDIMYPKSEPHIPNPLRTEHRGSLSL